MLVLASKDRPDCAARAPCWLALARNWHGRWPIPASACRGAFGQWSLRFWRTWPSVCPSSCSHQTRVRRPP